jgi:hypothetical protein
MPEGEASPDDRRLEAVECSAVVMHSPYCIEGITH